MSLSENDLTAIEQWLVAGAGSTGDFRRCFPGLSFTRLDPADVRDETPARVCPPFAVYLVDGRAHCWRLTNDPAEATGIVLVRETRQ